MKIRAAILIAVMVITGGCQHAAPADSGSTATATPDNDVTSRDNHSPIKKDGKNSSGRIDNAKKPMGDFTTPPPSRIPDHVLRDISKSSATHEARYDIAVSDQDAREFFFGLMQTMGKNIVVHPEVTGSISLYLQHVTLEEALTAVNDMYGYDVERNEYGYVILPAVLNTRVFAVDYVNVNRRGMSRTRVSSGQLTSTESEQSTDGNNTSSTQTSVSDSTAIETSNGNDFWTELRTMISMLVDTSRGGMVMVNPQSGLVVVRGMPHELRSIDNFLKRAQLSLNREVVLEAKILEVTLRDRFQAGINWSMLGEPYSSTAIGAALSSETLVNPDLIGGVFGVSVAANDFGAVIELLETQGDVSVLSSPRIATVNNQKAAIKVGTDEFFVTDVKSTTTSGVTTTQTPEVTLTPFFSGIVLDVTPQISDDDQVVLHVHPSVSEVVDQIKDIQIGDQDLSLPLALSSIREADSVVRARSNQIVLIGGLMSNSSSDTQARVPWLGKLPGVGALFRQQRSEKTKSELVILLRPIIAKGDTALPHGWRSEEMDAEDAGFTDGPWLQPPAAGMQ